jgi:hypothetical protein
MAQKLTKKREIQRLIELSRISRSCLGEEAGALKEKLDVRARIGGSLQRHPSSWLLGSLASGFAASLLFRGRSRRKALKKELKQARKQKRRGILGVLFGLILTVARPLAKVWLSGRLKQWTVGSSNGFPQFPLRFNQPIPPNPPNVHTPGSGPR